MSVKDTNLMLNDLVAWINNYCQARGRTDAIPHVDGQPWKLFTRQFRRILSA